MNQSGYDAHCSPAPDGEDCAICRNKYSLEMDFSYAFQPIIDIHSKEIFAHEALIRGLGGESAWTVLQKINSGSRYSFDQACRVRAIEMASRVGIKSNLSINFLPNAIYRPEVCIRTTLEAAEYNNFPIEKIIFETVEGERVEDGKWLAEVFSEYRRIGFMTAIDDFGAGYAGLNLLAQFQPDIIKLDMELIRGIDSRKSSQSIVKAVVSICDDLNIRLIAEGVETVDEFHCLKSLGVSLIQGYLLSRPIFEGKLENMDCVVIP